MEQYTRIPRTCKSIIVHLVDREECGQRIIYRVNMQATTYIHIQTLSNVYGRRLDIEIIGGRHVDMECTGIHVHHQGQQWANCVRTYGIDTTDTPHKKPVT